MLQMGIQPEGERKNDMGRPSFGEQGPHFILQSFYTLSCAYSIMGEGVESAVSQAFFLQTYHMQKFRWFTGPEAC